MANTETPQKNEKSENLKNGTSASTGLPKSYALHNLVTRFYFAVQVIADIVVITGSMLLGYWFYHKVYAGFGLGKGLQPFEMYLRLTVITNVIMLLTFERLGLYKRTISVMNIDEIKGIFKAVLLTAVILFTASFYFKDISYSRLIVTYSFVFLIGFLNIERYIFFKLFQKLHTKGIGVRRALIYGAGEAGRMLAERFVRSPRLGVLLIGFLDDNVQYWGKKIRSKSDEVMYALPCFGGFEQIIEAVREQHIDELFISIPSVPQIRIAEIIRQCEETGVKFYFIPNLFDYKLQSVAIESLDGVPLLTVKESHINWSYLFIKRIMDIIFALVGMVIFGPLMATLMTMVKRDSAGPAIFKQERIGLNGKPFMIYKFRTMYIDSPKYATTPNNSHDPRITKIGRFLRRSSLDELPQLLNVLKGEMAMVGPRPEMKFIVEQYDAIMRERLKVKPGITGMWQISADRAKQIHDNIDYDLYYIENFSPLLDVVIIIRTIFMAVKGKGAW